MIALLVDETCDTIAHEVETALKRKGKETAYISVNGLDIKTCFSCGYCSTKEYGKCFQKDDMEPILRILVKSEMMIVVTPIVFGSYSSVIKAVIDRSCVLGDTLYYMRHGEIVKNVRSDIKYQYVIGVKQECSVKERNYFQNLVAENINIMNIDGQSFIVKPNDKPDKIVEVICHE